MTTPDTPASTPTDDDPVPSLPCGRDPLTVVDHARAGTTDAHEQGCPDCQGALAAAQVTTDSAATLTSAEQQLAVPDTLLPSVMRTVWAELRRSKMIPFSTDIGTAFVTTHAVARLVEAALDDLIDLQVHTCDVTIAAPDLTPPGGADTATEPGPGVGQGTGSNDEAVTPQRTAISVAITAGAAYRTDVPTTTNRARSLITAALTNQFGWTTQEVAIDIDDVYLLNQDTP